MHFNMFKLLDIVTLVAFVCFFCKVNFQVLLQDNCMNRSKATLVPFVNCFFIDDGEDDNDDDDGDENC